MIIDINKLKKAGITSQDFEFKFDFPAQRIEGLGLEIINPCKIFGRIDVMNREVYVDAKIVFTVAGQCFRCLDDLKKDITADFKEEYSERPTEEQYGYRSGMLDLTCGAEEAILLNLPTTLLCREDCKGLCSSCGANLNEGDCSCEMKN